MALSWSAKRQLMIISGIAVIAVIILAIIIYPKIVKDPTCMDGKQNGTESGVDCGGICAKVCPFEANSLVVVWSRVFPSVEGYATAVAYLDNKNTDSGAINLPYEFRLFDDQGRIATSRGTTFIGGHGTSAVVVTQIPVGSRMPIRASFEFLGEPAWVLFNKNMIDTVTANLVIDHVEIRDQKTAPKISATINNNSSYELPAMDVIVIVYNGEGEALDASTTHLFEPTKGNSSREVFFTWPKPFTEPYSRAEIIPLINPFLLRQK